MSKITNFTWEEFWEIQEKYNDMLCDIEDRAFEIAKGCGKNYMVHQVTDLFFKHDNTREYVVVEFCDEIDGEEKFEYFEFDSRWLFSDNYKNEIAVKEAKRKAEEEAEYQEYLRLKKKYEK